ncbi:MAG: hypothetical protein NTV41_03880 [Actinobacteria bacterium]|jgi:hypothetical protein|nr:hypothetical protein [Actinomycetota bacterium]
MADKNFLSWVGFKGEDQSQPAPKQNALERIRELETQLNDMRSRRDITGLSREEFEILATETAMTMIKSAQQREAKANAAAQRLISETNRSTKEKLESAEAKAKSILSSAESRGRKYLSAAEDDAAELIQSAQNKADSKVEQSSRNASQITSAAKREAQKITEGASRDVADYRSWLTTAIAEAERLHRTQNHSLNAAEQAIQESRKKLQHAFDRLSQLQMDINANLDAESRPAGKVFVAGAGKKAEAAAKRKQKAVNNKKKKK